MSSSLPTIVGVDVGKTTCHIAISQPGSPQPQTCTAKRAETAATILSRLDPEHPAVIALELTGSLAVPIILELETSPHRVLIAQHTDTAAVRQLLRQRKKTDTLDAKLIARLAALLLAEETAPLVSAHLTPWPVMRSAILGRAHVRHLQALIRDRVRVRLQLQYATLPAAQQHLSDQVAQLTAQIKHAEALMLAAASPDAQLLATIPGVTLRRACILAAAIGDVTRFADPASLVHYCGLVPPHRPQSGSLTGKPIRRRSLDLLHNELHMFGLLLARYPASHSALGRTYQRVKARHGGKAAMWAAKRQLIRIAWGVLTSGQPHHGTQHSEPGGQL